MTQDEIIKTARQAGFIIDDDNPVTFSLEAFAKLVRNDYSNKHAQLWLKRIDDAVKAEREACAKIVEESSLPDSYSEPCLLVIAEEIRARGNT
jgi:hypothetical protein